MKSLANFIYTCDKDLTERLVRNGFKHFNKVTIDGQVFDVFINNTEKFKSIDFSNVDKKHFFTGNRLNF